MKITKGRLKQIILEELEAVEEAGMPPSPFPEYREGRFDKLFERGAPGDALAEAVANQLMLDEESDFQAMIQGIKSGLEGWYKGHIAARLPTGATPGAAIHEQAPEKMKTGQMAKTAKAQKKAMIKGGVTDQERAVISNLSKRLAAGAKKGNIATGAVAVKIQKLAQQLDKLLKGEDAEAAAAAKPEQPQAQVQETKKKRRLR